MPKSKNNQTLFRETVDLARLVVDTEVELPRPLDRRIAAVPVWTKTSDPSEGFDITVSASFGCERINIEVDEIRMDVEFSIKSATVELQFIECAPRLLDVESAKYTEEWAATSREAAVQEVYSGTSGAIKISASTSRAIKPPTRVALGGEWRSAAKTSAKSELNAQKAQRDWHLIGVDAIRIGRTGKPLDGPVLADLTAWHARPKDINRCCAVLARINVREDWVEFNNPRFNSVGDKWRTRIDSLLPTADNLKRRQFLALLRHLVHLQLQDVRNETEATLALGGVVLRPSNDHADALLQGAGARTIRLPSQPIERFFAAEEGYGAAVLLGLGVEPSLVPGNKEEVGERQRVFVPQSNPDNCCRALQRIKDGSALPSEAVPRNELRDLLSLCLVTRQKGLVRLKDDGATGVDILLRRAVALAPSIKAARSLLLVRANASPREVADAVALAVGKAWTNEATKQRHGMHVRRWAIWLEPHLLDPSSGTIATSMLIRARTDIKIKGPASILSDPVARRKVVEFFEAGTPVAKIAEFFRVTAQAVYKWKREMGY